MLHLFHCCKLFNIHVAHRYKTEHLRFYTKYASYKVIFFHKAVLNIQIHILNQHIDSFSKQHKLNFTNIPFLLELVH